MGKSLFIAEKPSVAQEFAKALNVADDRRGKGYLEDASSVVTWCVGHLVTMSYPEVYDARLKKWDLATIPFLPKEFKYEVIKDVEKQYNIVKKLLTREDVETIYVCTDSGREGEYIYRLVEQMAGVRDKNRKRVWIDSQTEEEILRGIREAKNLSAYDNLAASAYLRAKEDYLMGINFSRALTLKYGKNISGYLGQDRAVISVGRVMTCVLGMVVQREREIRSFIKTPFYRILSVNETAGGTFRAEWRAVEGSAYFAHPDLYKENGFKEKARAEQLIGYLNEWKPPTATVAEKKKKKEKKSPPLLYNLAELQNDCSRLFKISPDETLKIVQELYEKKLVTYPRTDARVLSTPAAKEITRNLKGLTNVNFAAVFAKEVLENNLYQGLFKSKYVNDSQITDHYAIVPTGQGLGNLGRLSAQSFLVYERIVRRFLSIFYPPAEYERLNLTLTMPAQEGIPESFFAGFRILVKEGYLKVANKKRTGDETAGGKKGNIAGDTEDGEKDSSGEKGTEAEENQKCSPAFFAALCKYKAGDKVEVSGFEIKEGETSPPKRYNSGSMILAMENAGQLIEDQELRAQIKGSGIGTSATRAEILKKLVNIKYLSLNKKTQIILPTQLGEMVHDVVASSIKPLLNPKLTASWEKGLTYVAEGSITSDEYMTKLEDFVRRRVDTVKKLNNQPALKEYFDAASVYYRKKKSS